MAIIFVYFNPCKYNRIIQNMLTVKFLFDAANIPYFIGEIKHNNDEYFFKKQENIFQYSSDSYFFYKENLINTIEKHIPYQFTKLCIMDFDILFDNSNWYKIISEILNHVNVTQPFKKAFYLNVDYTIIDIKTNCIDSSNDFIDYTKEHTGFIWAFNRKWFCEYKLNDNCISSMGDTILSINITKKKDHNKSVKFYNLFGNMKLYTNSVSYKSCDLNIYHLFHSPIINRQYIKLPVILIETFVSLKITSFDDVIIRREDNIIEWNKSYINIFNKIMLSYFISRNDDGY